MALRRWLTSYQRLLKDRPIVTNVVSGTLVMFLGDCAAQKFEQNQYHDFSRTMVMCSWAAVGDVPINLALFRCIDRLGTKYAVFRGTSLPSSIAKSCAFFVPGVLVRMPLMICYITTAETLVVAVVGSSAEAAKGGLVSNVDWIVLRRTITDKMEANLLQILDRGAKLWIPVNTAAFWLVPPRYRPVVLSSVASFWAMYLSILQHSTTTDAVPHV